MPNVVARVLQRGAVVVVREKRGRERERRDNRREYTGKKRVAARGLLPCLAKQSENTKSRLLPAVRRRRGDGARLRGEFGLSRFSKEFGLSLFLNQFGLSLFSRRETLHSHRHAGRRWFLCIGSPLYRYAGARGLFSFCTLH